MDAKALEAILAGAAEAAVEAMRRRRPDALAGRFAALERARLVAIALAWLEYERGRGDFEVVAHGAQDSRSPSAACRRT